MDRLPQSALQSVDVRTFLPSSDDVWVSPELKEHLTVISAGKIRDALPEDIKQAPDLLIIRGPDTSDHWMSRVVETAVRKGLIVHVLGKPADGISMLTLDEYKNKFSFSGQTHTWLLGHGSRQGENHQITIDSGAKAFDTTEVIKHLRNEARNGPVHVFSCSAGKLRGIVEQDKELSNSGLVVLHSSGKAIWDDSDISNAIEVVEHIGDCKNASVTDDPYQLAARLAAVAGDSITLVGGTLKKSLLIRAPASTEEAKPEYLLSVLTKNTSESGKQFVECSSPDSLLQFSKVFKENLDRHRNLFQKKNDSMLITRIARGDDQAVLKILEKNPSLAEGSPDHNYPPLYHAIYSNSSREVIGKLVATGKSMDWIAPESGMNIIHTAVHDQDTDILKRLLEISQNDMPLMENGMTKFDVLAEARTKDGSTALHLAILGQSTEIFQYLVMDFEAISQKNNQQQNAIHLAAKTGNLSILKSLLASLNAGEAKDLANRRDNLGNTPLHYAAMEGDVEMIKTLRKAGAERKKNTAGETPLRISEKAYNAGAIERIAVYGYLLNLSHIEKSGTL